MLNFLLPLIKPLAADFLVKRASKGLAKLVSKPENIKEVAASTVELVAKDSSSNVEDFAVDILIQVARITPNKRDDRWMEFIKEIKGDVRSLVLKIQRFRTKARSPGKR